MEISSFLKIKQQKEDLPIPGGSGHGSSGDEEAQGSQGSLGEGVREGRGTTIRESPDPVDSRQEPQWGSESQPPGEGSER